MTRYDIGGRVVDSSEEGLSDALASLYSSKFRPRCMCRNPGVAMYIAKIQGKFIVKRMPETGSSHHPSCDSFEPPPELSGLGEVNGTAIRENPEDGTTALKLHFSLTKTGGRSAPPSGDGDGGSVRTDGSKLTIRGMLHYLWEESGFNKWSPAMSGKRSWYVVRKYLLQAAANKLAKGTGLADLLYIPEQYHPEKSAEIAQRRMAFMSRAAAPAKGTRRLLLVIGEVKEIGPSRYGHKIVLKHLPDCHFMINEDLHKRMLRRFEIELGLWDAVETTHLMMIGTFGVGATGVTSMEEVALMCVSENWIPFETLYEKTVIDALSVSGRRFTKGLRYNLAAGRPLATAVLTDTAPDPTAMYVIPPGSGEEYPAAIAELVSESKFPSWIWRAGEINMPALPDKHS